jgi:anti-anti-sigma regulatory factor
MLRIMINEAPFEQKWTLQGKLCGQWAADLREKWADTRSSRTGRNCVIDLEDVITVDQTGEKALLEMAMEGARLTTRRAYMRSVLERLQAAPHEGNPNHVDH